MSSAVRPSSRPALLVVAVALACAPAVAAAQAAPAQAAPARAATAASLGAPLAPVVPDAGSYRFVLVDDDADRSAGTVSWRGRLVRIDMSEGSFNIDLGGSNGSRKHGRASARGGGQQWMLVDQQRGLLHIVKDDERLVETIPVADFENLVGRIMSKVQPVVRIRAADAGILAKDMGDGGLVAGVPTRHFRIIERYTQRVRAMGFDADAEQVVVTTDVRVPVSSGIPANPVATFVTGAGSIGAMLDPVHRANVQRAGDALWRGTPLAVSITSESRDADERTPTRKTMSVTTTAVSGTAPDAARFVLPDGYQRKRISLGREQ